MNRKILNLTYASSITNLCEVNSSFDSGILRIAYTGVNRNGSSISKSVFEKCVNTIYNCPIVCNYDRETDTLGGHDIEIVHDSDGDLKLINLTQPVGCIPESAKVFWEEVTEDDGTVHEYLCAEALLWKRQEAYKKIKEDGIVAHSMEITVKDGDVVDNVYHIKDFEFTAFALIGVEPCFESSSLETFSKRSFKEQLSEMMLELKESYNQVKTSAGEVDNNSLQNYSAKGGEPIVDKNELISKYGIDVDALDFSIDDYSAEELEEKFKAITEAREQEDETPEDDKYALMSNFMEELTAALGEEKTHNEWGDYSRYVYADVDTEVSEVYCWDTTNWLLYGFTYAMDGDTVIIDFNSKKRKKYIIADFDEGEQPSPFADVFTMLKESVESNTEWESKYNEASETLQQISAEVEELKQFKVSTEKAAAQNERDKVFARFADLDGVEMFEDLKNDCLDYDVDALENMCYAIRGRQVVPNKFALETKTPKIKVEKENNVGSPYGGLFEKYGFSKENN